MGGAARHSVEAKAVVRIEVAVRPRPYFIFGEGRVFFFVEGVYTARARARQ
jgi:hypothetical protein